MSVADEEGGNWRQVEQNDKKTRGADEGEKWKLKREMDGVDRCPDGSEEGAIGG